MNWPVCPRSPPKLRIAPDPLSPHCHCARPGFTGEMRREDRLESHRHSSSLSSRAPSSCSRHSSKLDVAAGAREGAATLQLGEHARHAGAVGHEGDDGQDGGGDAQLAQTEAEEGEIAGGEG